MLPKKNVRKAFRGDRALMLYTLECVGVNALRLGTPSVGGSCNS